MTAVLPGCLALVPTGFLRWFDTAPLGYWLPAWLAWIALLGVVVAALIEEWRPGTLRGGMHRLVHPAWFVLMAVAAMVWFRWPMVFAGPLMNPDETQHGAAAMTYWRDPVPWRSVDLHTSGPLNAYALWPSLLINGRVDYPELRLTALALHLLAALAVYGFLRRVASEATARLGALPLITFVAFTAHWEFVQYSSEQLSVALLAVAAWLIAAGLQLRPGELPVSGLRRLTAAGICLGCLPFAKMQAVPLGVAVGTVGLLACGWRGGGMRPRLHRLLALAGGALVPAILMAVTLTVYGLWAQFRAAYIDSNATYLLGYEGARSEMLRGFLPTFVTHSDGFAPFFWGSLAVAGFAALFTGIVRLSPGALIAAAWVLGAIGVWSVAYPGRPFGHYLHFLLLPLAWLGGLSLLAAFRSVGGAGTVPPSEASRWLRPAIAGGFALLTLVPQVITRAREPHPALGGLLEARRASLHPVSARLRALARPGDTMMVWGWFPRLHTESGIPQGTRESHNYREIEGSPMQRFFRDRTLRDLRRNQPAFFVDAVCEGSFTYTDRATAGLQVFPELAEYVEAHYRLEEELDGYRIYLRNDRFAGAEASHRTP